MIIKLELDTGCLGALDAPALHAVAAVVEMLYDDSRKPITGVGPEPGRRPKAEPKPEPKADPKPEPKADPKPEPKADPKPEPKADPKPEPKADPKPEPKADPETKAEAKPDTDADTENPLSKFVRGVLAKTEPATYAEVREAAAVLKKYSTLDRNGTAGVIAQALKGVGVKTATELNESLNAGFLEKLLEFAEAENAFA